MDDEVQNFLQLAARRADTDVATVLRRALSLDPLGEDPRFAKTFPGMRPSTRALLLQLDLELRCLNPGLHRAWRSTALMYRRQEGWPDKKTSERAGDFLCVIPRQWILRVVLPLGPPELLQLRGADDLRSKGRAGVGDIAVPIADSHDLRSFLSVADPWLRPDPGTTS